MGGCHVNPPNSKIAKNKFGRYFFHDGFFEKIMVSGLFSCEFSLIAYENINSSKKNRVTFFVENLKKIIFCGELDFNFINSLSSKIQDGRIVDSFSGKKISLQLIGGYFECIGDFRIAIENI